ncbi:MAG: ABC transporter permease subunit [Candidatus Cloacimonetes bacterium]|nr:ABC transporter permease subunit [Candidatus Cloacimonadota bacterium]
MKSDSRRWLGLIPLLILLLFLLRSLDIEADDLASIRIPREILYDLYYSLTRVMVYSLVAWLSGIIAGYCLFKWKIIKALCLPLINYVRNISPFAWLPFAIIWFGLGELPVAFIMLITLFFPVILATAGFFAQTPQEYIDEAIVSGATHWQILVKIRLPLNLINLVHLYRIIWGLAWSTIIAAEMLGVHNGLGFRLLDLRYLLKYPEMLFYLFCMGLCGILADWGLNSLITYFRSKYL